MFTVFALSLPLQIAASHQLVTSSARSEPVRPEPRSRTEHQCVQWWTCSNGSQQHTHTKGFIHKLF
eukprot:2792264-Rhodomonas_salina.1